MIMITKEPALQAMADLTDFEANTLPERSERLKPAKPTEADKAKWQLALLYAKLREADDMAIKCIKLGKSFAEEYPELAAEDAEIRAKITELKALSGDE